MKPIIKEAVKNPAAFLRPLNIDIHRKAAEILERQKPDSLLDIGTGVCLLLSILELPQNTLKVGCDIRMDNLREGRNVLKKHDVNNAALVQGWGQKLPFKTNYFSAVTVLTTFINIDDLEMVHHILLEIYRVMKPGGLGIFEFRNKYNFPLWIKHRLNKLVEKTLPVTMFTAKQFKGFLLQTGWAPEECIPIWQKSWVFSPSIIYTARKQ